MAGRGLTKRQEIFCAEYLKDFNATRAAELAGSEAKDLSVAGHTMLSNTNVKTHLAKLTKERNESVKVDMFYVVEKLKQVMEADFTEWADLGSEGLDVSKLSDMPKHIRQMVTSMKRTDTTSRDGVTTSRFEFKLMDKTRCLELLGKHVGAFTDRFQIDVNVNTFTDMVEQAKSKRLKDVTPRQEE